jgi:antitoxin MazE|tara:strand:+ start:1404 stop:1646 length:243 start_codon:yes stop_codon:yes gene_type:complete
MKATIKKWGNSPAIRLPSSIMSLAEISLDQAVNIHVMKGKIIIEPIVENKLYLNDMLARITPENMHAEESFGSSVGKEVL